MGSQLRLTARPRCSLSALVVLCCVQKWNSFPVLAGWLSQNLTLAVAHVCF